MLSDYGSESLDLNDPSSFRPLWKPVGALDEQRLADARGRRQELQRDADGAEIEPHVPHPLLVARLCGVLSPASAPGADHPHPKWQIRHVVTHIRLRGGDVMECLQARHW